MIGSQTLQPSNRELPSQPQPIISNSIRDENILIEIKNNPILAPNIQRLRPKSSTTHLNNCKVKKQIYNNKPSDSHLTND